VELQLKVLIQYKYLPYYLASLLGRYFRGTKLGIADEIVR
jgi:hypothetical protein